ncbi:hypothetical protein RsTz2092_08700 [Deferribacterales bacterium RsTz2092]|nr:hypothetical protein AGMMS49941_05980 [Deferribacterales bacterium]
MILGHTKQQAMFKRLATTGRLSHAYIFSGIDGIGKRTFAMELARGLLCSDGKFFEPCDCPMCKLVLRDQQESDTRRVEREADKKGENKGKKLRFCPDLYLLDEPDDLRIESIRDIIGDLSVSSYGNDWRVVVLDNAHDMGVEAANAFLKTLEEPSGETLFMLVSSQPDRLLPTIRSRCLNLDFEPLDKNTLLMVLRKVKINVNEVLLDYAGGSVSRIQLLRQLDFTGLKASIDTNSIEGLAKSIFSADSLDKLADVLAVLLPCYMSRYKSTLDVRYVSLVSYLETMVQTLKTNVNLNLASLGIFTKIAETLK